MYSNKQFTSIKLYHLNKYKSQVLSSKNFVLNKSFNILNFNMKMFSDEISKNIGI